MHSMLKATPGSIAFARDMLLNVPLIADFETLRQQKQVLINRNLIATKVKESRMITNRDTKSLRLSISPTKCTLPMKVHSPSRGYTPMVLLPYNVLTTFKNESIFVECAHIAPNS